MADDYTRGRAHDRWWDPEGMAPERAIWSTVRHLRSEDAPRRSELLRYTKLYANKPMSGLGPGQYYHVGADEFQRLRMHLTRSMAEAVQAKIAKNKPKASVLTDGGDFGLQQRAKRLEAYLWGQFWQTGLYDLLPQWFVDAAVWGTGVLKVMEADTDVTVERTYPWELLVDPVEAYYGRPRSLFHVRLIDRGVLRALFPEKKDVIDKAQKARRDDMAGPDRLADQVLVAEGWHLPSKRGAGDGVHKIAIEEDGGCLHEEEWKQSRFPFSFLRWSDPPIGFWGDSLAEQVEGMEMEVQELLTKIQASMYHLANPWVIYEEGSKFQHQHNNQLGGVEIEVGRSERAPTVQTHQTVSGEIFRHLDWLVQQSREDVGVGQLSATGQKPAGLESGRALLEMNDIESERFVIRGQAFEGGVIDVAELILEASKRIEERGKTVEVNARRTKKNGRKTFLERLKFRDVHIEDEAFELKIFPASSLPQSPAGRIQAVESLIQSGLLDREEALPLLDFPDVQSAVSRKLAPYEIVIDIMERILEDGELITPEPFMDLDLGIRIMQQGYLDAKIDGVPEEKTKLMREWIQLADEMSKPPENDVAPAGPGGGGGLPEQPVQDPSAPAVPAAEGGVPAQPVQDPGAPVVPAA